MPAIHHELYVRAPSDRIREALLSPDALRSWHGGRVTAGEHSLRFDFAAAPTYRWQVEDDVVHRRVVWRCLQGPGASTGTRATFSLLQVDRARSLVQFDHEGWPDEGASFRKCVRLWTVLLEQLRLYCEAGASRYLD